MTFEQDYDILIDYAKKIVWEKRLRSDPADLVNDAFIAHTESGKPYTISEIRKIILGGGFKEQNHQTTNVSEFWKPAVKITSSYCKACKDEKPISGFYLQDNNTVLVPFGICKDCYIKKQLECYYANKQKWLDAAKNYKENNKEKIKLKKQEYYLKNKVPKPVKVKPIKFKLIKLRRRKTLLIVIKPPKRIPLTAEEKRLKWNAYMRSRRPDAKPIDQYLKERKESARPIRELWREANKRYIAKQKENLTDTYIKSLLKRFGTVTPEMIKAKRQELQSKSLKSVA